MSQPEPNIAVNVDLTNPGQFFACCGLLVLADRLWPNTEGWFEPGDHRFLLAAGGGLSDLVNAIATAELTPARPDDPYDTPVIFGDPFRLVIDWWEANTGARDLKVWAGTMESFGIAQAMQNAMTSSAFQTPDLFNVGMVVTTEETGKKKEPYYFDARRAPNAHPRDVGFSPNTLKMTSIAHPAVELLCLVGLQCARPVTTARSRVYDYFTWHSPLLPSLLLPASTGLLRLPDARGYRFENWFRTGQKKHKAFRSARSLTQGE